MRLNRFGAAAVLSLSAAAAAVTVEIKGRVTNQLSEERYRTAVVVVTDRIGVELGRARCDRKGRYELKITGPRYIIVKANLEGFPQALYQLDTEEVVESTNDREENKVFGELRVPTYYQNITFGAPAAGGAPGGENPAAVNAYQAWRSRGESGDLNKAGDALLKIVEQYPDFYPAYIDLGMVLINRRETGRALEIFERAAKLRPDGAWAYAGMGAALNGRQDFKAAAPLLEKAVALDPELVDAQFQLGIASFKLGDHGRSRECLEKVVALQPAFHPLAYKTLASIYVARQEPRAAARALESYLANFPNAADAEKVRQILSKLGR